MRSFSRVVVRRRYVAYFDGPGVMTFQASTAHSQVLGYTINVYSLGTTSLQASRDIGIPTPDTNGDILHDIRTLLAPLPNANYTVKVSATLSSGTFESLTGVDFSVPLP